jgi:hypothetical protein
LGATLALAVGLYLSSGVQAGNCDLGDDTGPGVQVKLAENQAQEAQGQDKPSPPREDSDKEQEQEDSQTSEDSSVPTIPRIAPDEGC